MTICSNCFNASDIPTCVGELILGEVVTTEPLNAWFQTVSGSQIMYPTVNVDGVISVLDTDLPSNGIVTIWLNDPAENNYEAKTTISINGTDYTCISANVKRLKGVDVEIHDVTVLE